MKTIFRTLALSAAFLSMFTACQREELEQNQEPETPKTHTVTFVAGSPETKTTVNISDGETAKFAWTEADQKRFVVYENGVPAIENTTVGELGADGKMTLKATFNGTASEEANTYIAVVNSSNDFQIMYGEAYDESSDILVSKPVTTFDGESGTLLQFKREVAIAKMTLKELDAGEEINSVTISSNAPIASKYTINGWSENETDSKTQLQVVSEYFMDEETGYKITANESGEAVVWFTCIPQDKATLTVMVEAADGDTYTKEFGRAITLTRGDVKGFGVAMEKEAKVTPSYTIEFNNTSINEQPISSSTMAKTCIVAGTDYVTPQPFSNYNKCWYGGDETSGLPLRIGTSSAAGYVTLALSEAGKVPATKIILLAKQYSSGKTKVIGVNDSDKQKPGDDYTELSYDLDGADISSIKLDTDGYIYVKSITVEYGGTIKTKLTTPTHLAVSASKVVFWDAVANAGSYILTIGSDEFSCETNSYGASAIADEYYDVAVVAVPSDTENYKNSAPAILTDAKFGTPTLETPTLNEGSVDEFSVNATWTVDPRAENGYKCELYQGETIVCDSQTVKTGSVTFDNLDDGVTYTLKVNAIAVDGTKAYAASPVAERELTTKGTVTLSQITEAGTYTVKNVTVYAVVSISDALIGDGTAYFYLNKSSHGLKIGDTFIVRGTVSTYGKILRFSNPNFLNKASGSAPIYENAVEANEEYLTAYASAPKTQYIHAKGVQSGRFIRIGSQILYLSVPNNATDGKDVEVYGFVYGYNSSSKFAYFYATSITEDPTAPKLSVSPTSKIWESDGVDAATFTVTTNTEGEKGWKVSPETLDWATIVVNKDAGTITITPNGENRTGAAYQTTLTVTHSADATLKQEISLTQKSYIAVTEVSLDQTELSLAVGKTATLKATVNPSDATNQNVTWSSDKESVATVNKNGVVTAVAKGTATITVTTEDGGRKATCTVSVGGEVVTLFAEGFGSNTSSAREWNDSYKQQSGIQSVYQNASYTMTNVKQSKNSVGRNKTSGLAQSTANKDAIFEINGLDVSAYSNLTVSYYWKATSIGKNYSTSLYYSIDGGINYTEVTKDSGQGATTFVEVKYTLPAEAVSSNLSLKVVFNTSNTQAVIDDFVLKGTN